MSEQNTPSTPIENSPAEPSTSGSGLIGIVKAIIFVLPIVLVLTIVALALIGPSVGSIFSNIVTAL